MLERCLSAAGCFQFISNSRFKTNLEALRHQLKLHLALSRVTNSYFFISTLKAKIMCLGQQMGCCGLFNVHRCNHRRGVSENTTNDDMMTGEGGAWWVARKSDDEGRGGVTIPPENNVIY